MNTTVAAIYEQGALRLLNPLSLPESSRVQVQILTQSADLQAEAFARQLLSLYQLLSTLEDEWENDLMREAVLQLLQADLRTLWHLTQSPARVLCAMLQLAAGHLQTATLAHAQIEAIRFVLDRLTDLAVTEAKIRLCHERLTAVGLPPSFAFPAEMIQSYGDEH